jgi:antitoxin component of RelBE/YafQ-DinJ toxin-antitoxin module
VISDIDIGMKRRVLVQVSDATHADWKRVASEMGVSMSEVARSLIESLVMSDRVPVLSADEAAVLAAPVRAVSPADVAATVPGVKIGSAVCNVNPPGRSRPSCTLPAQHDGRHSWEAGS